MANCGNFIGQLELGSNLTRPAYNYVNKRLRRNYSRDIFQMTTPRILAIQFFRTKQKKL
jgi:hypothetical protein